MTSAETPLIMGNWNTFELLNCIVSNYQSLLPPPVTRLPTNNLGLMSQFQEHVQSKPGEFHRYICVWEKPEGGSSYWNLVIRRWWLKHVFSSHPTLGVASSNLTHIISNRVAQPPTRPRLLAMFHEWSPGLDPESGDTTLIAHGKSLGYFGREILPVDRENVQWGKGLFPVVSKGFDGRCCFFLLGVGAHTKFKGNKTEELILNDNEPQ